MKKHFIYGLIIIAGVLYSVSCQKSEPIAPESEQQETTPEVTPEDAKPSGPVYITATIPDDDISSKVSFEKDGTKWKRTWEVDDEVSVNGTIFTVQSVAENGTATLYSETSPDEADSYTITYGSFSNSQIRSADGDATGLSVFSLSGVRDYKAITFSSAWAKENEAEENGGAYSESGVLYLRAKMPDGIAATVKQVKITAVDSEGNPNNLFGKDNEVTVTFEKPGDKEGNGILDIFVNLSSPTEQDVEGTSFLVRFSTEADINNADFRYTRYYTFASDITLQPGKVNRLSLNCAETASHAGSPSADGTSDKAYLIGDKYQMAQMESLMESGETRYFKLVDDITLSSWTRLAGGTKAINLDGNGKTISNLKNALFQDLNGSVKNLTLENATVTSSASEVLGILACRVKTAAAEVSEVNISGSSVNATAYCGGLIGQADNVISLSHIKVTNTNVTGTLTGGIIGYPTKKATISFCTFDGGTITSNNQYCGGITGATANGQDVSVSDCAVKNATLNSAYNRVGGVVGNLREGATIVRTSVGEDGKNVKISMSGINACFTGGFVGLMDGGEISDNCYAYVDVTGVKNQIGGFIGQMNGGSVSGCKSYGSVSGPSKIGGFFGEVTAATTISGNESHCTVSATSNYVGGFAGRIAGSVTVTSCSHIGGNVMTNMGAADNGKQAYAGGFVGYAGDTNEYFTGLISECKVQNVTVEGFYHKNTISGQTADRSYSWVGGFAGVIGKNDLSGNTGTVTKCGVHSVVVSAGQYCAGFAGVSYSSIEKCKVSGKPTITGYSSDIGGFVGYQKGCSVKFCYSNANLRQNDKLRVGGLIGHALNTTVEECYSAGEITKSGSNDTNSSTWGGLIGKISDGSGTPTSYTRLIRWNTTTYGHNIVGGQTSTPTGCYIQQSGDNNFKEKASPLGWSMTIWNYTDDDTPTLVGL